MCDASDIEAALVTLLVNALYSNGVTQPSAVTNTVSIDRGWPTESDIRTATAAGTQLIRVHALAGMSRDVERYFRIWQTAAEPTTTLIATLENNVITFTGTPSVGQIVGILSQGIGYTYVIRAQDTLQTVSSGVASAVPGATSTGTTVTLPASGTLPGVDAVTGTSAYLEVGRQRQVFNISVWATTPAIRDSIFGIVTPALAYNYRLTMPDSSVATRFGIQSSGPNDIPSRANVWARDIRLTFDYPIITTVAAPAMAVGVFVLPSNTYYSV